MTTSPKRAGGTFRSLSIRNYRLYFIGQAISVCGMWMQTIGQDWLVLKLTNSGTQLGVVSAFQFLPVLFLAPFGGVIADRFSKRRILYFTQSIAGFLALALGALVITNQIQIWMIYLLALGLGVINSLDNPSRQTFVSEMVGEEYLTNAISLNSTEINLARVVGPTIAGVIIAAFGLAPCFLFNGFSYIAVIIALAMMKKEDLQQVKYAARAKGQLKDSFRYVKNSPVLLYTLLMMAIIGTFTYEFSVTLPLLARFTFHGGAGTYSILMAAVGGGAVIGGLFAASRRKATSKMMVISALLFGVSITLLAIMPNAIFAVVALFLAGVTSISFTSSANTILQLKTAPEMRGRVMSFWAMAFLGSTPIGGPIIGWIGQYIGPRYAVLVGGLAAIVAAGVGALTLLRVPNLATKVVIDPLTRAEAEELNIQEDQKIR